MESRRVDVAVVGAGLSGLVAARQLKAAGLTVCVLEARDRPGGRIEKVAGPGQTFFDGGGQFLGETQTRIYELLVELGLAYSPLPISGQAVRVVGGTRSTSADGAFNDADTRKRYDDALRKIIDLAHELSPERPWTHPRAEDWDSETFRTWTMANIRDADVRAAVESELMPTGPPTDVSLFHVLAFVRSVGDENALRTTEYGLVHGGAFQIPERVAYELGDSLILDTPVRAIAHGPTGVHVRSDAVDVHADTVIIALAPQLIERIDFTPDLPPRRRILQRRWVQMPSIKSIALYEKPWWRERGFNGQAVTDYPVAPFVRDASPPGDITGVLVSFTNLAKRPPGWVLEDADRRRSEFLRTIAAAFGPDVEAPLAYIEGNWVGRRWSHGCGQMLQCGVLSHFGDVLRKPVGRILWAGTEVSIEWPAYMEGAIRAGERAAEEALAL